MRYRKLVELFFKRNFGKCALYHLFGNLKQLNKSDAFVQGKLSQLPDGLIIRIQLSPTGPGISFQIYEGTIYRLHHTSYSKEGLLVVVRCLDEGFSLLTGHLTIKEAYCSHALSIKGNMEYFLSLYYCIVSAAALRPFSESIRLFFSFLAGFFRKEYRLQTNKCKELPR